MLGGRGTRRHAIIALAAIAWMMDGTAQAQVVKVPTGPAMAPPVAKPVPTLPPTIPLVPSAPPLHVVPPPPIKDTRVPDSGGADACDCYVSEQVPIMQDGRVIRYENRRRWIGKNTQCCPSR